MSAPLPNRPEWLDRATFDALLDLCGSSAICCGAPYGREGCGSVEDLTVDHIVPRWAGGTSELSNLQILCRPCNSRKSIRESAYWKSAFYWDRLPDDAGFAKLRHPQRELFNEIAHYRASWFGGRLINQISGRLYTNVWVVGAGKTLAIPVTAWALNQAIREHQGMYAPRIDHPLLVVKDQSLRDQIAEAIRSDLVRYGVTADAPQVGVVTHGWQFKQRAWIDTQDIVVTCEQQLWEANGSARSDLAEILARFPLIAFDEPHYAPGQVARLVQAATASLCVGFTGTPVDMWGSLLPHVVQMTIYDYQEASDIDQSVKYLDSDERHLRNFVREVDIELSHIIDHGQYRTTTSTQESGYDKNIECVKAVARGVDEELKARDDILPQLEGPAPHRRRPGINAGLLYPSHAIIFVEDIATAEAMCENAQKTYNNNRQQYPAEMGWNAAVAHSGGKGRAAQPLNRKPWDEPHPWMRAWKNCKLDAKCARVLFVVDMAREGLNNPFCAVTGVACKSNSILDAVQGWLGRQLRAVTEATESGLSVPPALLDTVRVITHSTYGVTPTIQRGIGFICDMRGSLDGLPTIDDLESGVAAQRDPQTLDRELGLPYGDRVRVASYIGECEARGESPTTSNIIAAFGRGTVKREKILCEWADMLRADPARAREELRLGREITPVTIVKRELLRHAPTDGELERFVRTHETDLAGDLPVTGANRRFFERLHARYADQFQQPPLEPQIGRDGKPVTINDLARSLVGAPVLDTLQGRLTCDKQIVWRYATSAVARKLGVPEDDSLKNGSDWDCPQTHHIIRRPEVQRELFSHVLGRLIDAGFCPSLNAVRSEGGIARAS